MKRKVRTRLLSALLALVMLVSLVPAAFAASSDIALQVDLGEDVYLSYSDVSDLSYYEDIESFAVYAYDKGCPGMYVDNNPYSGDPLDFDDFEHFNFYASSYIVYDDETYRYGITFYDEDETRIDTVDVYVTVGTNSGSSAGISIDAETDENGVLDFDTVAEEIYDYAKSALDSSETPFSVTFTSSDGTIYSSKNSGADADGVKFDLNNSGTAIATYYVYFKPTNSNATSQVSFTVSDAAGHTATGTIIVNSSSASTVGSIYAETDADGRLDMSDIANKISDYADDAGLQYDPYYVQFTNWTNGTMTDTLGTTRTSDRYYFDEENANSSGKYYLGNAWFEAEDLSKESVITFSVYDEYEHHTEGTIIVNVNGIVSVGEIKYSADYNATVSFSGSSFEDLLSSSQTLSYVTFTLPDSSKGTLYWDGYKLDPEDQLDSDDLDDVSFVPKSGVTGTVSISFKLYYKNDNSSTLRPASGTVVISIASSPAIPYDGEIGKAVAFDSGSFDDVCYEVTGRYLNYVQFSLPSSSQGTLYAAYDGTSTGSIAAKSTTKFYVNPDSNQYGLDDVVFVPAVSGDIELTYTAYDTKDVSYTGKVKLSVIAGTLDPINYTVSASNFISNYSVTFSASSFITVLKAKTTKALSSVTFTLPNSTEGILVYDNGSTRVSADTQYTVTGSTNLLDKVSFIAAAGMTDDVTIAYTATDSSGDIYHGTIVIKTFVGKDTVITYSTTGPAVSFSVSDFTDACLKKLNTTLNYVQFILPSASQGRLYYGYGTQQQTPVSTAAKYTASIHLPYVSFLPKAGFSGVVTLLYVGVDTTGESYTGFIQILVTPPTVSSVFIDANESWIAPAADFLASNNVYSGMVSGTTMGVRDQITRGEVMQMIYNAFNLKYQVPTVTSNFTDVPPTHPNYTAINAGNALGIALGVGGGMFDPDSPITRQDACTLLYRVFTTLGLNMSTGTPDDLKAFGDYATVADYAVDAVAGMISSDIIQGNENGDINPKGNLTRGEMSVILYRALTL